MCYQQHNYKLPDDKVIKKKKNNNIILNIFVKGRHNLKSGTLI